MVWNGNKTNNLLNQEGRAKVLLSFFSLFIIKKKYEIMAMVFNINKGATLPLLRMNLNNDGYSDYWKAYLALQGAKGVTFSMWDQETGVFKIANAQAEIVYDEYSGCEERYLIQYKWTERDTNEAGRYIGQFKISFSDDIVMDGVTFPSGDLIVPLAEDLIIVINNSNIFH